jgi:hypothetical protein
MRQQVALKLIDAFFEWVSARYDEVKNTRGLLRSACGYAVRQEQALRRYLEDGRLKITNNHSERALTKKSATRQLLERVFTSVRRERQPDGCRRVIRAWSTPFGMGAFRLGHGSLLLQLDGAGPPDRGCVRAGFYNFSRK